jgi:hypothetical protein
MGEAMRTVVEDKKDLGVSMTMCIFAASKRKKHSENEENIEDGALWRAGTGGRGGSAHLDGVRSFGEGRHVVRET